MYFFHVCEHSAARSALNEVSPELLPFRSGNFTRGGNDTQLFKSFVV